MRQPLVLVLVHGPGLPEPWTSLHDDRAGARAQLAGRARALLADRLGYVPARLRGPLPDLVDLVDELAGIGLNASVDELLVEPTGTASRHRSTAQNWLSGCPLVQQTARPPGRRGAAMPEGAT